MHRIIVADDEASFRDWARTLLNKSEDFEVVGEARDGEEAIRLIESLVPDVVLVDICMPERDGFEVARYAREHFPGIRLIAVSAHEEPIYNRLARDSGTVAFVPKASLSLATLIEAIEQET